MPRLRICMAAMSLLAGQTLAAREEMSPRPTQQGSRATKPAAEQTTPDTCGQRAALRLVGTVMTPQSRTTLTRDIGHDRIRVIRPGAVITQDLRNDRLNLIVDESGRLMTARCG